LCRRLESLQTVEFTCISWCGTASDAHATDRLLAAPIK
jgi:hypothetical protein